MAAITKNIFGKTESNKTVYCYQISNNDLSIEVIEIGAILKSVVVHNEKNKSINTVLGFDKLEDYCHDEAYIGATVGPYANRIRKGALSILGDNIFLEQNDGKNHIHGGKLGFNKVLWDSEIVTTNLGEGVQFCYPNSNYKTNYPGNLLVKIRYILTDSNEIVIDYEAKTDEKSVFNPTNHTYFNLSGNFKTKITNHYLKINSNYFLEIDDESIPTGKIIKCENTPFDFRNFKKIGENINEIEPQLVLGNGYDHNFVINKSGCVVEHHATLKCEETGIEVGVFSDMPGMQLYTGNYLDKNNKNLSINYSFRSGVCLETQYYPDSPNNPKFPNGYLIYPNKTFKSRTIYKYKFKG